MAKKRLKIPQDWTVQDGIAFMYVTRRNGTKTKITASPEDVEMLSKYLWHICGKGYAWTAWAKKDRKVVSMHSMVLGKRVDHINNDPLDNQDQI